MSARNLFRLFAGLRLLTSIIVFGWLIVLVACIFEPRLRAFVSHTGAVVLLGGAVAGFIFGLLARRFEKRAVA